MSYNIDRYPISTTETEAQVIDPDGMALELPYQKKALVLTSLSEVEVWHTVGKATTMITIPLRDLKEALDKAEQMGISLETPKQKEQRLKA